MKVINRDGIQEDIDLNKINERIQKVIKEYLNAEQIDSMEISIKVIQSIRDGISTKELDEETSRICMNLCWKNPEYGKLGSIIMISNHQKNTKWSFTQAIEKLYNNSYEGKSCPLISTDLFNIVKNDSDIIENMINHDRDFLIDYFGFSTLQKGYLLRTSDGIIQETPQYLFMRVALSIWGSNMKKVLSTYNMLSEKYATHATPTLFNAGSPNPGLASCFLLGTQDSVTGVYKTLSDCAQISKWAGGIGIHISNIRCKDAYIRGTGGKANGILPMLKIFNDTARYINQSGKRNGSFAMFIEPWHGEIFTFLKAMRNHGAEDSLARDLFFALWIPNLFMDYVRDDKKWYLMCPDECPNLNEVYGKEFETLYLDYVKKGKYQKCVPARDIFNEIVKSQIEAGMPYMLYKDHINEKSNQKNIGVIKSSNLCSEIVEYSNDQEYAVCTLASICLPQFLHFPQKIESCQILEGSFLSASEIQKLNFIKYILKANNNNITPFEIKPLTSKYFDRNETTTEENSSDTFGNAEIIINGTTYKSFSEIIEVLRPSINYDFLRHTVRQLVENLNRIIDTTFYPVEETKRSNVKHRPIGIGVQGLADLFLSMWMPYDSEEAAKVNKDVFEAIYYFALEKSCELAKETGPYSTFEGSPLSQGKFQFDLWNVHQTTNWDWEKLRTDIKQYGVKNSLLIALMPTASTSQIMGFTECFEPRTSNIYTRRTLSGEFQVVNTKMIEVFKSLNMWNENTRNRILKDRGSVKNVKCLEFIRNLFKTAWEIKKTTIMDMSAVRGAYVCQSQSLNFFIEDCNSAILTKIHSYGYRKGLKTGSYYIRTKPSVNADTFTIEFKDDEKECISCGS